MKRTKIAIIGIGDISHTYLPNLTGIFKEIEVIGVCDLIRERAEWAVREFGIPKLYEEMHEAFADEEVEIILNLTRPDEHYDVTKGALLAGKHVYSEKPLAATLEKGAELVALAEEKGLYLGGAPDTFLGGAIQTARKLIDEGAIGEIVSAAGFMKCRGHETWHPDPEFYYKRGGGPMLDMGPYYVTAFANMLGSAVRVTSMTRNTFPERTITSKPKYGQVINPTVPTHVAGLIEYESGAIATLLTSFDIYPMGSNNFMEIYGTEGCMIVPDPNNFGNPVKILRPNGEWEEIEPVFDYTTNDRGLGLCDMANAIRDSRRARCDYGLTYHVLEVMMGLTTAGDLGHHVEIKSRYDRTAPMCVGLPRGILD